MCKKICKIYPTEGALRHDRKRRENLPWASCPSRRGQENLPLLGGLVGVTERRGHVRMGWLPCACDRWTCREGSRMANERGRLRNDGRLLQPYTKEMENMGAWSWASGFDQRHEGEWLLERLAHVLFDDELWHDLLRVEEVRGFSSMFMWWGGTSSHDH